MNAMLRVLSRAASWLAIAAGIATFAVLATAALGTPPVTAAAKHLVAYPAWTLFAATSLWLGASWAAQRHGRQVTS